MSGIPDTSKLQAPPPQVGPKIPWGSVVGGLAAIGAAHTLGYFVGGIAGKQLERGPMGQWWAHLPTLKQQQYAGNALAYLTAAGSLAALGRSSSFGQHIEDSSKEVNSPNKKSEKGQEKMSMLVDAYEWALENRR